MEDNKKILFIRTTDRIIQIDYDKDEKIEKIMVCENELKNW